VPHFEGYIYEPMDKYRGEEAKERLERERERG
jgi:hypothetical protein